MIIITRSGWKAEPPKKTYKRHNPNKITIHHSYMPRQSWTGVEAIQSIQRHHKYSRKWNDIGYHYLIDGNGDIYEGRPDYVVGGHVKWHNTNNIGICIIGDYTEGKDELTDTMYNSWIELLKYLVEKYNIGPDRIYGHCEFNNTSCPAYLMSYLPTIQEFLKEV